MENTTKNDIPADHTDHSADILPKLFQEPINESFYDGKPSVPKDGTHPDTVLELKLPTSSVKDILMSLLYTIDFHKKAAKTIKYEPLREFSVNEADKLSRLLETIVKQGTQQKAASGQPGSTTDRSGSFPSP